jgi:hypothetical protein
VRRIDVSLGGGRTVVINDDGTFTVDDDSHPDKS